MKCKVQQPLKPNAKATNFWLIICTCRPTRVGSDFTALHPAINEWICTLRYFFPHRMLWGTLYTLRYKIIRL
uniref:Uncharacterized protein n=1 Tax=Anguilla anguilla TaxID=7936 RepID=A0A0E9XFF3_ANGAN